jgi:hypothetical protein
LCALNADVVLAWQCGLVSVSRAGCQHERLGRVGSGPHIDHSIMRAVWRWSPCTAAQDEVRDMAKKLGAAGMQLLVIDTENKFVSTGFAEEIAKVLPGVGVGRQGWGEGESTCAVPCSGVVRVWWLPSGAAGMLAQDAPRVLVAGKVGGARRLCHMAGHWNAYGRQSSSSAWGSGSAWPASCARMGATHARSAQPPGGPPRHHLHAAHHSMLSHRAAQ